MAHVYNLGIQEGKAGGSPKFKYSLSYRLRHRLHEHMSTKLLLSFRLPGPGRVGDAGCQWNYTADPKRKGTATFPTPSLQAVEARERTQSD